MQLKYFVSIANTSSFTTTARFFHMTQPAISHQIRALEREYAAKLFARDSRQGIHLTDAGRALLPYAEQIIDLSQRSANAIRHINEGKTGQLRIAGVAGSINIVSEIIAEFSSRYPDINVGLDIMTGCEQMASMNEGRHDIYFSCLPQVESNLNYSYVPLTEERCCLFIHRDLAEQVDADDPRTYPALPMVRMSQQASPYLMQEIQALCRNRGIDLDHSYICDSFLSLSAFVNNKQAFAILPDATQGCNFSGDVLALPIAGDDAIIPTGCCWQTDTTNQAVAHFIAVTMQMYRKGIKEDRQKKSQI